MSKLISFFNTLGIRPEMEHSLKQRIQINTWLGLVIIFFVCLPFSIISLIYFTPLTYLPASGAATTTVCLFLSYWGFHRSARLMMGIFTVAIAAVYNAYMTSPSQEPVYALMMLELSFSLLTFLVFDPKKERVFLLTSLTIGMLFISTNEYLRGVFVIELDSDPIRHGFLAFLTSSIACLIGFVSIYFLVWYNLQGEKKMAQVLSRMNEQNQNLKQQEESLKSSLDELERAKEEDLKQQWITEGVASFATLMRTHSEADDIFDHLLSFIVKYIKANQGGLFLKKKENSEEFLEMEACFAYNKKKFLKQRIEIGDGLVGQAFLEQETIYLTEIPDSYVKITSGLGESNPTSILIVPLIANEKSEGIIELAFFKPLEKHEIKLLEDLAETLASTIGSHRVNTQIKNLAEELQGQTEQMRAQEEEMRQNMEELQATQEEMHRKENEYIQLIETLQIELDKKSESEQG